MENTQNIIDYITGTVLPASRFDSHSRKVAEELLSYVVHRGWQDKSVTFMHDNLLSRHSEGPGYAYTAFCSTQNELLFEVRSSWPKGETVKTYYKDKSIG